MMEGRSNAEAMNILDQIIAHKWREIEARRRQTPAPGGEGFVRTDIRPFGEALRRPGRVSLIAEYKKASPSKGLIRADAAPTKVAGVYASHGAAAVSVLTDQRFFQGHADDLTAIRTCVSLPVLRKDFIVDAYQIREALAMGADAVLLIAAALSEERLAALQNVAHGYGLACLVEVHTGEELAKALRSGASIIGINNRDLTDFSVDLGVSLRLKRRMPAEVITVSESGIHTREDVLRLQDAGFDAILVGESLMRSPDIGAKLDELLGR
jgi:indole-3-glycerol phosphate synthase